MKFSWVTYNNAFSSHCPQICTHKGTYTKASYFPPRNSPFPAVILIAMRHFSPFSALGSATATPSVLQPKELRSAQLRRSQPHRQTHVPGRWSVPLVGVTIVLLAVSGNGSATTGDAYGSQDDPSTHLLVEPLQEKRCSAPWVT